MARSRLVALSVAVAVSCISLAACKNGGDISSNLPPPSKAFCDAAAKLDAKIAGAKILEQIALVSKVAETAPVDTKKDAEVFLRSLERRNSGDKSVVGDKRIKKAVDHVNRRASQDCGWFKNNGI